MQRGHLDDLLAFIAVGQERSFTKAAAKLGVSHVDQYDDITLLDDCVAPRTLPPFNGITLTTDKSA